MVQPLIDAGIKVDIFVSNPPYIPSQQEIESVVKDHEPHVALFGGQDGLYFYRQIFNSVEAILKDKAVLAFEMGYDQKEDMEKEVKHYFPDYPFEIIKKSVINIIVYEPFAFSFNGLMVFRLNNNNLC